MKFLDSIGKIFGRKGEPEKLSAMSRDEWNAFKLQKGKESRQKPDNRNFKVSRTEAESSKQWVEETRRAQQLKSESLMNEDLLNERKHLFVRIQKWNEKYLYNGMRLKSPLVKASILHETLGLEASIEKELKTASNIQAMDFRNQLKLMRAYMETNLRDIISPVEKPKQIILNVESTNVTGIELEEFADIPSLSDDPFIITKDEQPVIKREPQVVAVKFRPDFKEKKETLNTVDVEGIDSTGVFKSLQTQAEKDKTVFDLLDKKMRELMSAENTYENRESLIGEFRALYEDLNDNLASVQSYGHALESQNALPTELDKVDELVDGYLELREACYQCEKIIQAESDASQAKLKQEQEMRKLSETVATQDYENRIKIIRTYNEDIAGELRKISEVISSDNLVDLGNLSKIFRETSNKLDSQIAFAQTTVSQIESDEALSAEVKSRLLGSAQEVSGFLGFQKDILEDYKVELHEKLLSEPVNQVAKIEKELKSFELMFTNIKDDQIKQLYTAIGLLRLSIMNVKQQLKLDPEELIEFKLSSEAAVRFSEKLESLENRLNTADRQIVEWQRELKNYNNIFKKADKVLSDSERTRQEIFQFEAQYDDLDLAKIDKAAILAKTQEFKDRLISYAEQLSELIIQIKTNDGLSHLAERLDISASLERDNLAQDELHLNELQIEIQQDRQPGKLVDMISSKIKDIAPQLRLIEKMIEEPETHIDLQSIAGLLSVVEERFSDALSTMYTLPKKYNLEVWMRSRTMFKNLESAKTALLQKMVATGKEVSEKSSRKDSLLDFNTVLLNPEYSGEFQSATFNFFGDFGDDNIEEFDTPHHLAEQKNLVYAATNGLFPTSEDVDNNPTLYPDETGVKRSTGNQFGSGSGSSGITGAIKTLKKRFWPWMRKKPVRSGENIDKRTAA